MTQYLLKSAASRLILAAALAGLGLSACNKAADSNGAALDVAQVPAPQAALPLDTGSAAPMTPAPPADALPEGRPLRYGRYRGDSYAFAERAYEENEAFDDAPPDYTYDDDGVRPWIWRSDDGAMRIAERLAAGDRYYYYEPGASTPYLIRDPNYSYAYDDGQVVAVYGADGRLLDDAAALAQIALAARYFSRGQTVYAGSNSQQHLPVAQANWLQGRTQIASDRKQWVQAQKKQPAWSAYHAQQAPQEQAQWNDERYRRESEAARLAVATNDTAAATRYAKAAQAVHNHQPPAGESSAPARLSADQEHAGAPVTPPQSSNVAASENSRHEERRSGGPGVDAETHASPVPSAVRPVEKPETRELAPPAPEHKRAEPLARAPAVTPPAKPKAPERVASVAPHEHLVAAAPAHPAKPPAAAPAKGADRKHPAEGEHGG